MARKRRRTSTTRALWVFALGLLAISIGLSWVARPAPSNARPRAAEGGSGVAPPKPVPVHAEVLRLHFYDVGEGLAVLVDLPGGRHLMVDSGDSPQRERCGDCVSAHRHLLEALSRDLGGAPIDLLWITHQHSDHIGGARDILEQFLVKEYVDNGRESTKPEVARTHDAARARATVLETVSPSHPWRASLAAAVAGPARVTSLLPLAWPNDCGTDPNECSLPLRIDYFASSILFTGDAERGLERSLPGAERVTLLQVGHHGSETSSSEAFLARVAPRYAVISAGHPGVGMNAEYCLPRAATLERVNQALGGGAEKTLLGFDGKTPCKKSHGEGWVPVPVSDRLWATERDGDVVLETRGDGTFAAVASGK